MFLKLFKIGFHQSELDDLKLFGHWSRSFLEEIDKFIVFITFFRIIVNLVYFCDEPIERLLSLYVVLSACYDGTNFLVNSRDIHLIHKLRYLLTSIQTSPQLQLLHHLIFLLFFLIQSDLQIQNIMHQLSVYLFIISLLNFEIFGLDKHTLSLILQSEFLVWGDQVTYFFVLVVNYTFQLLYLSIQLALNVQVQTCAFLCCLRVLVELVFL